MEQTRFQKFSMLEPISRAFNYIFAPFRPSEWKTTGADIKSMDRNKAKYAMIKTCIYYLLFSPLVAMPFYNTCIFHPYATGDYNFTELAGVKKQDVFFTNSDGQTLHGWYFAKPGAKKTILFSHGNAGNITHRKEIVQLLLGSGVSVFIYDYSGYGLSHGSPSIDGCIKDAVAAYDCLTNQLKQSPSSIILYGESLGTAITAQLAQQRVCSAVILQSAFQSLPQIGREKIPLLWIYPAFMFPCNKLDTLSYVKGKHPPLLIIHGAQDNLIPVHNADDLYAAASPERFIIKLPNAGHNDVPVNFSYEGLKALVDFVR